MRAPVTSHTNSWFKYVFILSNVASCKYKQSYCLHVNTLFIIGNFISILKGRLYDEEIILTALAILKNEDIFM